MKFLANFFSSSLLYLAFYALLFQRVGWVESAIFGLGMATFFHFFPAGRYRKIVWKETWVLVPQSSGIRTQWMQAGFFPKAVRQLADDNGFRLLRMKMEGHMHMAVWKVSQPVYTSARLRLKANWISDNELMLHIELTHRNKEFGEINPQALVQEVYAQWLQLTGFKGPEPL
jgi:hypothetical protein